MLFTDLSTQRELVHPRREVGFKAIHADEAIGMPDGFNRIAVPRHQRPNLCKPPSYTQHAGPTDQKFKEPVR
ncbi:MAG TPA: hypothetical protein VLY20_06590 [Nitrospiria bacterium]|nr:hypothetical protein [Nitrospiria bacterium]